jgi:ABC-type uncharacterized transport system ATPase component
MTKIVARHSPELLMALGRRTVVMDEGKIVADGNRYNILEDISLLKARGLPINNRLTDISLALSLYLRL